MATRNGAPGKELRVKRQQLAIPDLGDVGDVVFLKGKVLRNIETNAWGFTIFGD